jgi:uncharacterized protein (TIGR00369 family)
MTNLMELGLSVLERQSFSQYLGTELVTLEPGRAVLALTVRDEFKQQHGFVHGGVLSYLVDNALTFAGGSVLGANVITVEFKVNYGRPARGERLVATGVVESSGSRLAVCRCDVVSVEDGKETRCAMGQGTIAVLG